MCVYMFMCVCVCVCVCMYLYAHEHVCERIMSAICSSTASASRTEPRTSLAIAVDDALSVAVNDMRPSLSSAANFVKALTMVPIAWGEKAAGAMLTTMDARRTYVHICIHIFTCIRTPHTHIHTHTFTNTHSHTHMDARTCIHTHARTHARTHTHTHTQRERERERRQT